MDLTNLEEFARVEYGGSFCIVELREAPAMNEDNVDGIKVTTVMMTRDQFNKLPEFSGF